jgi:hypothetical protein
VHADAHAYASITNAATAGEGKTASAAANAGEAVRAATAGGVRDPDGGDPVVACAAGGAVRVPLLRAVLPGILRGVQVLQLRPGVRAGAGGVRRVQGMPDLQRRGPQRGVHRHVNLLQWSLSSVVTQALHVQWLQVYYWSSHIVVLRGLNLTLSFAQIGCEYGMTMFN